MALDPEGLEEEDRYELYLLYSYKVQILTQRRRTVPTRLTGGATGCVIHS